jgi:hypothetical protein
MLLRVGLALLVLAIVVVATGTPREAPQVSPSQAADAALQWVGAGSAEPPRESGGDWEVDVVRPNGSLVEVTIGDRLELQGLDEELRAGRRPAHDELTGPARAQAIRAALAATGPGRVLGVERESGREAEVIEVDLRRRDGSRVEVGLDSALNVVEIEPQHPGDE